MNDKRDAGRACAVETFRLEKRYGGRTVLNALDLSIARGEMFALLGPNGSGKSTFFRILSTLTAPDGGRAEIDGLDVTAQPAAVRTRLGVVFQSPSLDRKLTVRENLRYGGALYGLHGRELDARIDASIAALRLTEKSGALVETLSGGQQRRAEIAKCLLTRPSVLLLDEPSTGLDPAARIDLWAAISSLRAESGMTVVFTSHLMDESSRADRVGILSAGTLVTCRSPQDLLRDAGPEVLRVTTTHEREVAEFLSGVCGLRAHAVDGEVRAASADAHATAARLSRELPDALTATTIARPTLEDVFLFETGRKLDE